MLTARKVIISCIVLFVALVGLSILQLTLPPDGDGLRPDSFGTRPSGYRALYELLAQVKIPVERGMVPPTAHLNREVTLVIYNPEKTMIAVEPDHLERVAEWVRKGGRMVYVPAPTDTGGAPKTPPPATTVVPAPTPPAPPPPGKKARKAARKALNIQEVDSRSPTEILGLGDLTYDAHDFQDLSQQRTALRQRQQTQFDAVFEQIQRPMGLVNVKAEGEWSSWDRPITRLEAAQEDLRTIDIATGPPPAAWLSFTLPDGTKHVVAAKYNVGQGQIVVIGDPSFFQNENLARYDNAVLAAQLFHGMGRPVVFDEFFHGLTVRGNPFWLLTRQPYSLLAFLTVLAVGIWAWRQSVHLGPALAERSASRRSLADYIDAMARLFWRGGHTVFMLRELREGTLWNLRRKLGLPPQRETLDDLVRALERRKQPERAKMLREAVGEADQILQGLRPNTDILILQAARKLQQCL